MKIYKHEGKGHYIGSCIIVAATHEGMALSKIRQELIKARLRDEVIELTEIDVVTDGQIIYSNNGDY